MSNVINNITDDFVNIGCLERAALWDFPKDSIYVSRYIRQLQELTMEIKYNRTRSREMWQRLKAVKRKMISDFEAKIDRIWNDQKSGTKWDMSMSRDTSFEPHQVVKQPNLVTWQGLTLFTEIIAQEVGVGPTHMGMGSGDSEPTFGDETLETEVARIDLMLLGDLNSDGTVIKCSGSFPTGLPDVTISEFASFDDDVAGRMVYRTVIDNSADKLGHIQNRTIVQSSHSIELVATRNKLD